MKNNKTKYAQSRLQKKILSLSAFLLLAAIVWLDTSFHPHFKTYFQRQQKTQDVNDWDKYNEKVFTVVKVVDGDTIDINIPDDNYKDTSPVRDKTSTMSERPLEAVSNGTRIRLLGVDTPETKNPHTKVMYFGPEASKFTTDTVLGQNIIVIMDKMSKPRDKYNRLLSYIRLPDGRILNEELISQGFGYADTRFPHSFYEKYIQLEKTAREEKKGLWGKVTPGQMPQWRQKENHVLGTPNGE